MRGEKGGKALSDDRLIRRLLQLEVVLRLKRTDFVIFGSAPLLAHGLRPYVRDLDVVARGSTWELVDEHGIPGVGDVNGARLAGFWDGLIQFSRGWISDCWDADRLIDGAEIIDGLPFARLADVLKYKQALRRAKDQPDIQLLAPLLNRRFGGGADSLRA